MKNWFALLAWFMLIWVFMFVFAPWLQQQSEMVQTLATHIDESGVDAGAIYYTEVEEVSDADLMVRDTLRFYLPQQKE